MDGKRIGYFIKEKRIELGFTVEQFAAEVGVTRFLAEDWENGTIPETQHLLPIANVLKCEVEDLLKGSEPPTPPQPQEKAEEQEERQLSEVLPQQKDPQKEEKSYYEELNEKIKDLPTTTQASGENGFSAADRKFGYILLAIFVAILLVLFVATWGAYLTRERNLTVENYREYLTIKVLSTRNVNPDTYEVRVTAKNRKIYDLDMEVGVTFRLYGTSLDGNGVVHTVTFDDADLVEGETVSKVIHLSIMGFECGYEVINISGGLD
ncbi:MAG: helix-turn-helix domain-containing protein [Clostridia bacterium]|nr:helix-turn-helix domain-containing protein [Clostridia bacterium]